MMRTIQLAVACVAVLVATAGHVRAGLVLIDFNFRDSSDIVVASGSFQFDEALDGTVLGFGNLSSFQFSVPSPGSGTIYDLAFLKSGSFSPLYGMAFDTSTDSFQTVNMFGIPVVMSAVKANFNSGFFARFGDSSSLPGVRDYIQGDGIPYTSLTVERSSVAAVPEPSSLALLGIVTSIAGVGAARRRWREKAVTGCSVICQN
jgi:hypothetical protein